MSGSHKQTTTKAVSVPTSDHVAFIIGHGGSNIKKMVKQTGVTEIKSPTKGDEPVFIVIGDKAKVAEAANLIRAEAKRFDEAQAVNRQQKNKPSGSGNKGTVTKLVWVQKELVGKVIGKGGGTVKKIQTETNTEIKTPTDGSDPVFIVMGEEGNVAAAEQKIKSIITSTQLEINNNNNIKPAKFSAGPVRPEFTLPPVPTLMMPSHPSNADFLGQLFGAMFTTLTQQITNDAQQLFDGQASTSSDSEKSIPAAFSPGNKETTDKKSPRNKTANVPKFKTVEIPVTKSAVGFVIGNQATTIKTIAEKSGTRIETPSRNGPPIFKVSGTKNNIKQARRLIEETASKAERKKTTSDSTSHDDDERESLSGDKNRNNVKGGSKKQETSEKNIFSIEITVPATAVGLVIGAKGTTISEIQKVTNTKIVAPNKNDAPVFKVFGSQNGVIEACSKIDMIVAAAPTLKNQQKTKGNSQNESSSSSASDLAKMPQQQGAPKTIEISVSEDVVGLVIGEKGAKLLEIEKSTNTKIDLKTPLTREGEVPIFKVTGSRKAINKARQQILNIAASARNAGKGSAENRQSVPSAAADPSNKNNASTIFVRNVDFATTEGQLREHFKNCGQVKWITILKNKKTNTPLGNVLIQFSDESAAKAALLFDGTDFHGRKISVSMKSSKKSNAESDEKLPTNGNISSTQTVMVKRHVVIDADNVCMAHGRNDFYSARGLELAINYFETLGHKVLAVVPEEKIRCSPDSQQHRVEGQDILCRLEKAGKIVVVPRKKLADGSTVKPYADLLTVKYAFEEDGVIISNDNMIDVVANNPQYKDVVESRRIMFTFAGDKFMIIDDPNGRTGLHASDLLSYKKEELISYQNEPDLISFF